MKTHSIRISDVALRLLRERAGKEGRSIRAQLERIVRAFFGVKQEK